MNRGAGGAADLDRELGGLAVLARGADALDGLLSLCRSVVVGAVLALLAPSASAGLESHVASGRWSRFLRMPGGSASSGICVNAAGITSEGARSSAWRH